LLAHPVLGHLLDVLKLLKRVWQLWEVGIKMTALKILELFNELLPLQVLDIHPQLILDDIAH
jgi:hypothetical protein